MDQPVTVVLGLGREVGEAVARRFIEAGHAVLAADPDREKVESARKALGKKGRVFTGELDTAIGLRNCLARAEEEFERIDNIVAIPVLPPADSLATLDWDRFNASMRRATEGAARTMRLFADRLSALESEPAARASQARQRGSITFILSIAAHLSQPDSFTQSAAQGAIEAMVRASAVELAAQRVRTNAIVAVRPRADAQESWLKSRTPLGRAALADEVAEAALYLASRNAAIVTGESLVLDGGRSVLSGCLG